MRSSTASGNTGGQLEKVPQAERITETLKASRYCTSKTRATDKHLYGLICPACGKPEAWAYANKPSVIICNRKDRCGAIVKTLDVFPELRCNFEKEFPPTNSDPHRPATEYLKSRGLNGCLTGLEYAFWSNVRKTGSGAIMFPVADGVYNGRLISPPAGEGKTHNSGKTTGMFWKHPTHEITPDQPLYLVEGIIDALSLNEAGCQAIAVLSCGADPVSFENLPQCSELFIAFDNDSAGAAGARKWLNAYQGAKVVMPPEGKDWNDLLQESNGTFADGFQKNLGEYKFFGALATAKTALKYAEIFSTHREKPAGLFAFRGEYYYGTIKDGEAAVVKVSNFTLEIEHIQYNERIAGAPENRFHLKVTPKSGRVVYFTASADDLSSEANLIKIFLKRARSHWFGAKTASTALVSKILEQRPPVIRQLDALGYDAASDVYAFKTFAVLPSGKMISADNTGILRIGYGEYLRPAVFPCVAPVSGYAARDIYTDLCQAFPGRAEIAIGWAVAAWFINLVKSRIGFFPFLSLYGDVQAGKSTMMSLLNRLQGIDEEGLQMSKSNTAKGELRKLGQRSGLYFALLEGQAGKMRFDLDTVLTLYNNFAVYSRAVKSADNQTSDIECRAALAFVQNQDLFYTRAQRERVIAIHFKKDDQSDETLAALGRIQTHATAELASFFKTVMTHRPLFEGQWEAAFKNINAKLLQTVHDRRIAGNYAILATFHALLMKALGIDKPIEPLIEEAAAARAERCALRDANVADGFIDALLALETDFDESYNFLKIKDGKLYFHLVNAMNYLIKNGKDPRATQSQIIEGLKEHPAYIKSNHQLKINGNNLKVWVIDMEKASC